MSWSGQAREAITWANAGQDLCRHMDHIELKSENGVSLVSSHPGGRLNKKDGLTRYGDSHVKDKTS